MLKTLALLLTAGAAMAAATPPPESHAGAAAAVQKPAAASAAAPAGKPTTPPPPAPMTGPQVIQLLDATIDWYRTLGIQQQAANQPSDLLILYDNRQTANRVVALAFEIARADADLMAQQPTVRTGAAAVQPMIQMQAKFAAQSAAVQAELESDQKQLTSATPKQAVELKAKISELQGELDLSNTRKNLVTTMLSIAAESDSSGLSATSLRAQIDAMAVSMTGSSAGTTPTANSPSPAAAGTSAATTPPGASASLPGASINVAARFGIWDLAANVFKLSEKVATIDGIDRRTADLADTFSRLRNPLVEQLKALSARGDALATQADTADTATLNQTRDQLDSLADQFKAASVLLIPLGKTGVLLSQYRRNLANWRGIIETQYHDALKTLGVRVTVLAAVLAVIFAASQLWQRAVTRYVHDARRRYQLLLVRRIVLWSLVVIVVGFAFASELGSIVTFAGLITAGIAVAMQSVLVSIVGYFFLIGKYGIRVGDHIQIGEVSGEVIELGLVRLHLMELGGHGQLGPTGRVVAFANSIVFQVATGLFKQIPGVNFTWHEVTLALPAGVDYAATKDKLLAAVNTALKDSRDEIVRQTQEIQRTTASSSGGDSQPRVQLSFAASGVEAHVRYPVHLRNAAEIDERVSRELVNALGELGAAAHKGTV